RATPTIRLSTVSVSSRPNGVWAHPMMQAVMAFSSAELWALSSAFASSYGTLTDFSVLKQLPGAQHNPGEDSRQHFCVPVRDWGKLCYRVPGNPFLSLETRYWTACFRKNCS